MLSRVASQLKTGGLREVFVAHSLFPSLNISSVSMTCEDIGELPPGLNSPDIGI